MLAETDLAGSGGRCSRQNQLPVTTTDKPCAFGQAFWKRSDNELLCLSVMLGFCHQFTQGRSSGEAVTSGKVPSGGSKRDNDIQAERIVMGSTSTAWTSAHHAPSCHIFFCHPLRNAGPLPRGISGKYQINVNRFPVHLLKYDTLLDRNTSLRMTQTWIGASPRRCSFFPSSGHSERVLQRT